MIANPAITRSGSVPHPFTLNDLRVQNTVADVPSSASMLTYSGLALAAVLATGAFVWLDPLHMFTPTEVAPPAPAIATAAAPARPIERQEIVAPLTPVPAAKSVEAPPAPVVRAPQVPAAPVARPRVASIKPEARGNPSDKPSAAVRQAAPEEMTAPLALVAKPEEKTDAPVVPKVTEETKSAPKPAATSDPTPVSD